MKTLLSYASLFTLAIVYPASAQIYVPMESAKPGQRTITDPRVPQEKNVGGDVFNKPIVVPQSSQPSSDVNAQNFEAQRQLDLQAKTEELKNQAEADKKAAQEKLDDLEDQARREGEAGDNGPTVEDLLDEDDIEDIVSEGIEDEASGVRITDPDDVTHVRIKR